MSSEFWKKSCQILNTKTCACCIVCTIINTKQIENNIITPKIVGDTMGLSGFWILVTTITGGGLFGFWGLLICIPVAASIKMLFNEYRNKKVGR